MEITNQYLELSVSNNTNSPVRSILEYKGLDLTEAQDYTKLNVWKWNIICKNFPTWLPKVKSNNYINQVYVPMGYKESDIFYGYPSVAQSYFLTDWGITVKYTVDHLSGSGDYPLVNCPVCFLKPKQLAPIGVEYDDDDSVTEKFALEDKTHFFWGDSTLLCDMVTNALTCFGAYTPLPADSFKFVKNGEYWSILVKVSLDAEKIYFNDEMRMFFDFPYDYDNGITVRKEQITTINNIDYYVINTIKTNNYLFPFRNVVMRFDSLNIYEQFIVNNSTRNNENPTDNILTRYTLNITDINQIGNVIEYSTESKDRAISLTNSPMSAFTITVYLQTFSKYLFELSLQKLDEINILFMIS